MMANTARYDGSHDLLRWSFRLQKSITEKDNGLTFGQNPLSYSLDILFFGGTGRAAGYLFSVQE